MAFAIFEAPAQHESSKSGAASTTIQALPILAPLGQMSEAVLRVQMQYEMTYIQTCIASAVRSIAHKV